MTVEQQTIEPRDPRANETTPFDNGKLMTLNSPEFIAMAEELKLDNRTTYIAELTNQTSLGAARRLVEQGCIRIATPTSANQSETTSTATDSQQA